MKNTARELFGHTLERAKAERLIIESLQEVMMDFDKGKKDNEVLRDACNDNDQQKCNENDAYSDEMDMLIHSHSFKCLTKKGTALKGSRFKNYREMQIKRVKNIRKIDIGEVKEYVMKYIGYYKKNEEDVNEE